MEAPLELELAELELAELELAELELGTATSREISMTLWERTQGRPHQSTLQIQILQRREAIQMEAVELAVASI